MMVGTVTVVTQGTLFTVTTTVGLRAPVDAVAGTDAVISVQEGDIVYWIGDPKHCVDEFPDIWVDKLFTEVFVRSLALKNNHVSPRK